MQAHDITWRPIRRIATIAAVALATSTLAGCPWSQGGSGAAAEHAVGGTISGLASAELRLANGADTVAPPSGATAFTFPTPLADGDTYAVTVAAQPAGATCSIAGSSGTVDGADVISVQVACVPSAFTIGGSITGLSGSGLVLTDGTGTASPGVGATGFTLSGTVPTGTAWSVSVQTAPAGQSCSVSDSAGVMGSGNVTSVAVTCAALSHPLGGTISGLVGTGLVLANGSDTLSPAAGDVAFTFANPGAEGGQYALSVQAQPTGQVCSVGSGTGTMGTSAIADVQVSCASNAYGLGGTISGLAASGLVLANGSDTVSPAAGATSFAFAHPVAYDGSYSVTVKQQPSAETCTVSGTYPAIMGAGNVSVSVTCAPVSSWTLVAGATNCGTGAVPLVPGPTPGASLPDGFAATAFDAAGNVYLDYSSLMVKVTPDGTVSILAGSSSGGYQADGTGAAAVFSYQTAAEGLATDSVGNLYVSDWSEIRKVTQAGVVTTLAGIPGIGGFGQGYVDGKGANARLAGPAGIVVDSAGNVYFMETANEVLRMMTPDGTVTTVAGGGPGHFGFVDGTGSAARFSAPYGLAIDAAGNLYVADWGNNAIRKVTSGGVVTTLAGGGPNNAGYADGTGTSALFSHPQNLSIDAAGNLYVTDQDNYALREITPAGVVTTVAVATDFTSVTKAPVPAGAVVLPLPDPYNTTYGVTPQAALVFDPGCAIYTSPK